MTRLLIAIKSCKRDWIRGFNDVIRETWGKDVPKDVDLRFFTGDFDGITLAYLPDEIELPCRDEYDFLPAKSKAILNWSLERNYDFTFLADTDTFVIPKKLLSLPFQQYDLSGRFGTIKPIGETFRYVDGRDIVYDPCWPWPSGGCGYFVSKKMADIIVRHEPSGWAEDMFVGQIAGPLEKQGLVKIGNLEHLECYASWHFPRRKYQNHVYDPKFNWMTDMQREHGEDRDSH